MYEKYYNIYDISIYQHGIYIYIHKTADILHIGHVQYYTCIYT